MTFKVELSARSERDIETLLTANADRYTTQQRLKYATSVRELCLSLNVMPRRYEVRMVNRKTYRRARYKAHHVYYREIEEKGIVFVYAILHVSQEPSRHL